MSEEWKDSDPEGDAMKEYVEALKAHTKAVSRPDSFKYIMNLAHVRYKPDSMDFLEVFEQAMLDYDKCSKAYNEYFWPKRFPKKKSE